MPVSTRHRFVAATAIALACLTPLHGAQAQRRDVYAPIVLQVPAGVRAAGLSGVATNVRDVESIFANPALVGQATGTAFGIGQFNGEARVGTLAASLTAGAVNTAIGVQFLDHEVVAVRVPVSSTVLTHPAAGAGESLVGTFALATTYRGYRVGAALKYVEERLSPVRDGAPSVDVGIAKDRGQVVWGLTVQNLGPDIDFGTSTARQPLRATLGAATFGRPVGPLDFTLATAVSVLRNGFVSPAVAMEWGFVPLDGYDFVVRAGVRRPELAEQRPLSLGASFTLDRFSVDYAFESFHEGAGHRIGLRIR